MWIYASSVASMFRKELNGLLDELRAAPRDLPARSSRTFEWGDVDYTVGGSITMSARPAIGGEVERPITVRPRAWVTVHQLVPGRPVEPQPITGFRGTDDVTWLLCHQAGGRNLAVDDDGPYFLLDLAATAEGQQALAPSGADRDSWQHARCECADLAGDDSRCEGPRDLIRVVGGDTARHGCSNHAIGALVRDPAAVAEPGSPCGYTTAAVRSAVASVASSAQFRRPATTSRPVPGPQIAEQLVPADPVTPVERGNRPVWWRRWRPPRG